MHHASRLNTLINDVSVHGAYLAITVPALSMVTTRVLFNLLHMYAPLDGGWLVARL